MGLTVSDIRDAFTDYRSVWKKSYQEGDTDMRYLMGDPWDPEDRREREDAGRPCLSLDELTQYINQYNNNLRENKRGIQIIPKGFGSKATDAEKRENAVRGIEYASTAQDAYITAAESAVSRGYGFALLRTEYKEADIDRTDNLSDLFQQKIVIKRVPNPNMILLNPDYETSNARDLKDGFVLKRMRLSDFKREYSGADKVSFDAEDITLAPDWIAEKDILVAEYWHTVMKTRKLVMVHDEKMGVMTMWDDVLQKMREGLPKLENIRERDVQIPKIVQIITNGVEELEKKDWAGSRIPIISCFGKEMWVTPHNGSAAERHLLSIIRLARDAQMLFAYLCSSECEEVGMSPKTPFVGYEGQFEKNREAWSTVTKQPWGFLEVDRILDGNQQVLPLPTRPQFQPNIQSYEVAKESVRRSIQAAMGITPLPTAAQRNNEKSGVALEKIQTEMSVGSFHYVDNYEAFLDNMGFQINELMTPIMDTEQTLQTAKNDGTFGTMQVIGNTSHPITQDENGDDSYSVQTTDGKDLDPGHLHTGKGNFGNTVSTAPAYESQRQQASEFVDLLIKEWQTIGIPAALMPKFLALAIRLKQIGPEGDEMINLLTPPDLDQLPPEVQAMVQQLQGQIQQLQQENQALHLDRAGRVLEQDTKKFLEQMKQENENLRAQLNADLKAYIANVQTKAQNDMQRQTLFEETQRENAHKVQDNAHEVGMESMKQAHEKGMAADQQAHEHAIADKNASIASAQSSQDAAQDAANNPPEEPQA